MIVAMGAAMKPIISDLRSAAVIEAYRSTPIASAPNQCCAPGGALKP